MGQLKVMKKIFKVEDALRHIAHDYAYLVASGQDTQKPQSHPFNHYAERTFLVHCRSLAKFFIGHNPRDMTASDFTCYAVFFAAFIAAQRFFVAILIALLPAALILRFFGFAASACVGSEPCLNLLYRARCAAAIFRRVAALNFFRGLPIAFEAAGSL